MISIAEIIFFVTIFSSIVSLWPTKSTNAPNVEILSQPESQTENAVGLDSVANPARPENKKAEPVNTEH